MSPVTQGRRLAAAAAVAGLTVVGAPHASAAPAGELEAKGPLYYCEKNQPQVVVYVRSSVEQQVSYRSRYGSEKIGTLGPRSSYGRIYSAGAGWGGFHDSLTFTGASGGTTSVTVAVPTRCTGLPTSRPASGWGGRVQDPKPAPAPSEPTTPSPTAGTDRPAPGTGTSAPTSAPSASTTPTATTGTTTTGTVTTGASTTATTATPAGGSTPTVSGPPVQTDYTGKGTNNASLLVLLGLVVAGAATTAGAATRRLGGR